MAEKKLDKIKLEMLKQVADLHDIPEGAYSLRVDGETFGKNSSENIIIEKKTDKPGIDIYIKSSAKRESASRSSAFALSYSTFLFSFSSTFISIRNICPSNIFSLCSHQTIFY